jgi:hypothetical protein
MGVKVHPASARGRSKKYEAGDSRVISSAHALLDHDPSGLDQVGQVAHIRQPTFARKPLPVSA